MAKYVNPIGAGLTPGRTDQGVDFSGAGPLYALGSGTIVNLYNSGWPGGTFIVLKLDSGQGVYYAEDITPAVHNGQRVKAGQVIGHATGGSTGIEVGWASLSAIGESLAAQQGNTGGAGHSNSPEGIDFAKLLKSLGVKLSGVTGSSQTAQLTSSVSPSSSGSGSTAESWNPIQQTINEINPVLGWLIGGFHGTPSSIGDLAGGIGGLVTDTADFLKLISWLFVPAHWLRIAAFFAGVLFLGGSLYMFKEAL